MVAHVEGSFYLPPEPSGDLFQIDCGEGADG